MVVIREKVVRARGVASTITADGSGRIEARSGASAVLAVGQTDPGLTPVELLDAALAGCLVISIRHAAKQHGWLGSLGEVSVTVSHEKATDLPSRVAGFTVSYTFTGNLLEAERQALISEAHRLCTVGNTLTHGTIITDG